MNKKYAESTDIRDERQYRNIQREKMSQTGLALWLSQALVRVCKARRSSSCVLSLVPERKVWSARNNYSPTIFRPCNCLFRKVFARLTARLNVRGMAGSEGGIEQKMEVLVFMAMCCYCLDNIRQDL